MDQRSTKRVASRRQLVHELLEDRTLLAQTTGLLVNEPGASDGYTLFSPNTTDTTYLIDSDANIVNEWQSSYPPGLLSYLLPDGSLIRESSPFGQTGNGYINAAGAGGLLERFDWAGDKTWEFEYSSPTHLAHHDFEVLPNGNILLIAWELKTEVEATQAGRDPNLPGPGYLYPDHIVEVRPDLVHGGGKVVWEWHIWDHLVQDFDPTKDNWEGPGGVADHPELININYVSTFDSGSGQPEDWTHCNGIDYNPDLDEIVISSREFSEVWIIDHSTTPAEAAGHTGGNSGHGGDLLYRWGNPQTYDRGDDSDRVLYYQHDPKWVEDGLPGAGDITVFNNGIGRPGQDYTSVDELTPPRDASGNYILSPGQAYGPATPDWVYTAAAADFTAIIGGTQRLPNGDTLVTYGVKGTFSEVTPEGDEVWRYVSPYISTGQLGPNDPVPSLGIPDPLLGSLYANFAFRAIHYSADYLSDVPMPLVAHLFYNDSTYDDNDPAVGEADDNAIATDKSPYFAGSGVAQPENATSYANGINGLMVDLYLPGDTMTADDFLFKVGSDNSPGTWIAAPVPGTVVVRQGAGAAGSDRVEVIWPDGAIRNTWLQVTVKGNDSAGGFDANTGLAASEVFYFGNIVGDSFFGSPAGAFTTNVNDEIGVRGHYDFGLPVTNVYDFTKDGLVNVNDELLARANYRFMPRINIAAASSPVVAPADSVPDDASAAVASALAAPDRPARSGGSTAPRQRLLVAASHAMVPFYQVPPLLEAPPAIRPLEGSVVVDLLDETVLERLAVGLSRRRAN